MKTIQQIIDEVTIGDPVYNEMGETFVWRYKCEMAMKEYAEQIVDRCVEVVNSSAGEYSQIGSAVMLVKTEIV